MTNYALPEAVPDVRLFAERLTSLQRASDWRAELQSLARELSALAGADDAPIWGALLTRAAHSRDSEAKRRLGYVVLPGNDSPQPFYACQERAAWFRSDSHAIGHFGCRIMLFDEMQAQYEQYRRDHEAAELEIESEQAAAELEQELREAGRQNGARAIAAP